MTDQQEINYDSYVPYYIQLIEALRKRIKDKGLKPGDKLPSEPDMCDMYGVSRTVVRQALRELELQGLVTRRKGKGTFVAQPKIHESLVQSLTGFYQDMVERGHISTTKVLQFDIIPAPSKVAQYLEIEPGTEVYSIERLRYVENEPILLVTTYIPCKSVPGLTNHNLETQSLYELLENTYGLKLARGRRAVEAVSANRREAKLLQISRGDPLILLDSVTYLDNGVPIEYYHAVHRGDRSRFEVELVRISGQKSLDAVMSTREIELPSSH